MKRVNAREILAGPELHRKPMGSTAQGTEAQDEIGTAEAQADRAYGEAPVGERAAFWVLYAKGGSFSRFYADLEYSICWHENGKDIKGNPGAVVRNEQFYFISGLTWTQRTQRGFNLRRLPSGAIFDQKATSIFCNNLLEEDYLLACLNTDLSEYLLRALTSFGSYGAGVVARLPVPHPTPQQRDRIGHLAKSIHDAKASWDQGNEISTHFTKPWILREDIIDPTSSIPERLDRLVAFEAAEDARIQKLYNEINNEVYHLYGIPDTTRQAIEEGLGERPSEIIWPQMERKDIAKKRMEHVWRLLSYVVKRVVDADEDGIVPFLAISGEPGLIDRVHHELEVLFPDRPVTQVEIEIKNELKRKVKGYRRTESLREWLEDVFFDYHASLFKNRPILWHIASKLASKGSAAFGALIHYHRFDKDRMAKLRGSYLRDAISLFRREAGLAAQEGRADDRLEWQARIEEAEALDERLRFVQEGHHEGPEGGDRDYRILTPWKLPVERPVGWAPDIDDGVKVNLEPLQKAGGLRKNDVVG